MFSTDSLLILASIWVTNGFFTRYLVPERPDMFALAGIIAGFCIFCFFIEFIRESRKERKHETKV